MHTLAGKAQIGPEGNLHLDLPAGLPPGEVDVVVIIQASNGQKQHDIKELRGLGKEIWQGRDAQETVDRLRDEWAY